MEIRTRDIKVEDILKGAEYLGCGASKEAYLKNGIVYKVPRGRILLQNGGFNNEITYPSKMEEVDEFLEIVNEYEPALVWPLGQFTIELITWEALRQLEIEDYDISCFARIKDYYFDKNGVIVIEQEATKSLWSEIDIDEEGEVLWNEFTDKVDVLEGVLEDVYKIKLRDIRDGNCGMADGMIKLFDFGISTTTMLDSYGSYSDYTNSYDYE